MSVWRTEDEVIDWFVLVSGQYERLSADADGLTRSRVLPGVALDLEALLKAAGDAIEESGLRAPPHPEREAPPA